MSNNFFENNKKIVYFILILWPYIFLFPLSLDLIAIGNDFDLLYFSYKKYILELISQGIFPFWSPSEAAGVPLIFNPFAQYFYIPGWFTYVIYFFKGELNLHDYLLFTIFSFSIFNVGLYLWLRQLRIDFWPAFTACLVACCSLKLTEILRFPNACNAAAWFPWILYGITLALDKQHKSKSFLIIFFSFFFVLTAGYPYFIIYSLFLFCPYILFISFKNIQNKIFFINRNKKKNYFSFFKFNFFCGFAFFLSFLFASPWLLKVKSFMDVTTDRTVKDWAFSTEHEFFWQDTIGSWLFPPAASVEGWYYFGIITSILIFFYILSFFLNKKKNDREKLIIISSIIWFLFITYFSWGKYSYFFYWSWHNLPLIGNLRTWGRINIILVPIIALILSMSISYFLSLIDKYKIKNNFKDTKKIILTIFFIFIVFILVQYLFIHYDFRNQDYWEFWQKKRFSYIIENLQNFYLKSFIRLYDGGIYIIFSLISLVFFVLTILNRKYLLGKNFKFIICFLILFISASELFLISNVQWSLTEWKTPKETKKIDILNELRNAFLSKRVSTVVKGNTYFRNNRKFNINYPDQFGYQTHTNNYDKYFDRNGNKKIGISFENIKLVNAFYGLDKSGKKIFFTNNFESSSIEEFMKQSFKDENESNFIYDIELDKYDGNRLYLKVYSDNSGWLNFIDNWDPGWKAWVNNKEVKISKLFNSYKSIKILKGKSDIIFRYYPW